MQVEGEALTKQHALQLSHYNIAGTETNSKELLYVFR